MINKSETDRGVMLIDLSIYGSLVLPPTTSGPGQVTLGRYKQLSIACPGIFMRSMMCRRLVFRHPPSFLPTRLRSATTWHCSRL